MAQLMKLPYVHDAYDFPDLLRSEWRFWEGAGMGRWSFGTISHVAGSMTVKNCIEILCVIVVYKKQRAMLCCVGSSISYYSPKVEHELMYRRGEAVRYDVRRVASMFITVLLNKPRRALECPQPLDLPDVVM